MLYPVLCQRSTLATLILKVKLIIIRLLSSVFFENRYFSRYCFLGYLQMNEKTK